jgi:hypothetical protein
MISLFIPYKDSERREKAFLSRVTAQGGRARHRAPAGRLEDESSGRAETLDRFGPVIPKFLFITGKSQ